MFRESFLKHRQRQKEGEHWLIPVRKRKKKGAPPLQENAIFWMFLVLLSIGCITSLYGKASAREADSRRLSARESRQEALWESYEAREPLPEDSDRKGVFSTKTPEGENGGESSK